MRPIPLLLLAAAAAACTAGDAGPAPALPTRTIDPVERVALGVATGKPAQEFSRIVGVLPVGDSALLVASAGTHDVRLFALDGEPLRTFGREGDGPGEYRGLHRLFARGDTMRTLDVQSGRVDYWPLAGGAPRSVALPTVDGARAWTLFGFFDDGSALIAPSFPHPEAEGAGTTRTQLELARWTPGGAAPVRVTGVAWGWSFTLVGPTGSTGYEVPLRAGASLAVADSTWWYTSGAEPVLHQRSRDGRLLRSVALPFEPAPVTDRDRAAYAEAFTGIPGMTGAYLERARQMLAQVEYPERLPGVTALVAASDGTVWAGRHARPGETLREWYVVARDGSLRERVLLPADLRLFAADGEGRVYGVRRDASGVERAVVYALVPARER